MNARINDMVQVPSGALSGYVGSVVEIAAGIATVEVALFGRLGRGRYPLDALVVQHRREEYLPDAS